MRREALGYALLLAIASSPSAADSRRLDRFGDPLPEGAIIRLGTTRFRPASPYGQFALSPDGKTFATGENRDVPPLGRRNREALLVQPAARRNEMRSSLVLSG